MKSGWIAAFQEAWHSPLLELWQLQDSRRRTLGFWLSSPGLLLVTVLLSSLLYLMLVRQLLALQSALAGGGMNPLQASAVFWIAANGLLKAGIIFLVFFILARLYRALADSGNLINGSGRGRVYLDGGISASPLGSRHIIAAQHIANIRLLLPAMTLLFTLQAIHRLAGILGLPYNEAPGAAWLVVNMLVIPLASLFTSCIALLILGNILIGNGAHGSPLPLQLGGAATIIGLQLFLFILSYPGMQQLGVNGLDEAFEPMSNLLAMLVPGLLFLSIPPCVSSPGWRRIVAGGFGLIPFALIALVTYIGNQLYSAGLFQWDWDFACSIWWCILLQSINVVPSLADGMVIGGVLERNEYYNLLLVPGIAAASIAIVQWLLLRSSLHYALQITERQRSLGEVRHAGRPSRPLSSRQLRFGRIFDTSLATLLTGGPLLLAFACMLGAIAIPVPKYQSRDDFGDWLFRAMMDSQTEAAWNQSERQFSSWTSMDNLLLSTYIYGDEWDLHSQKILMRTARRELDSGSSISKDPRLLALIYLGMEQERFYDNYSYYWQIHGRRVELLEKHMPPAGNSLLLQFEAESRLQALYEYNSYPATAQWMGVFSNDPQSQMYGAGWLEEDQFNKLAELYMKSEERLGDERYPRIREVQRLLVTRELEVADRMMLELESLPELQSEHELLAALELPTPMKLDWQTRSMIDNFRDDYMALSDVDTAIISDATSHYLAAGRLGSLQRLHDYWWDISGLTGLDTLLLVEQTMLDSVPQAVMQEPANAHFIEMRKLLRRANSNAVFSTWTYYQWGDFWSEETLRTLESSLAFGRYTPYSEDDATWDSSYASFNQVKPYLQDGDLQLLAELQSLDWTSLDLSAAQAGDFTDPAAAVGPSST